MTTEQLGDILKIEDGRAIAITSGHTLTSYRYVGKGEWQPIGAASVGPFDVERTPREAMQRRADEAWEDETDPLWIG